MIEKMIIQDSSEVHSVWIPDRRSLASFAVWKAFGLGHHAHWREGQIMLGVASEGAADHVFFAEFPGYADYEDIPEWVDEVIGRIDSSLPSAETIFAALDADSVTMTLDPPAYRLPASPSPNDAATCALASRLLLLVAGNLVPPTLRSCAEVEREIDFASRIAVLLGGNAAAQLAVSTAGDSGLCDIIPDPALDEDRILTEAHDD